ncbi:MAG: phosphatase [Candidatus Xenobiia bacterium LiM19]
MKNRHLFNSFAQLLKGSAAFCLLLFFLAVLNVQASPLSEAPPVLIADPESQATLDMRNFRTMTDEFRRRAEVSLPSREGLSMLNVSGSSQFSAKGLCMIKEKLAGKKIVIVDLREESHGFINGVPVSWRGVHNWENMGKSLAVIEKDEKSRLLALKKAGKAKISWIIEKGDREEYKEESITVKDVMTEQELCASMGVEYLRIPVSDHLLASDSRIDYFIRYYCSIPADRWLHFHCKAGKGRTTTFISLCDMMRNAKKVTCDDIVSRQQLLGGTNLFSKENPESWKYPPKKMRALFTARFHQYCLENSDGFKTPWSAFRAAQDRL